MGGGGLFQTGTGFGPAAVDKAQAAVCSPGNTPAQAAPALGAAPAWAGGDWGQNPPPPSSSLITNPFDFGQQPGGQ